MGAMSPRSTPRGVVVRFPKRQQNAERPNLDKIRSEAGSGWSWLWAELALGGAGSGWSRFVLDTIDKRSTQDSYTEAGIDNDSRLSCNWQDPIRWVK